MSEVKEQTTEETPNEEKGIEEIFYPEDEPKSEEGSEETKTEESNPEDSTEDKDSGTKEPEEDPKITEEGDIKLEIAKDSSLEESDISDIIQFAKDNELSQEQAQAFLEREDSILKGMADYQQSELEKQSTEWLNSAKTDEEIGGKNFDGNVEAAYQALEEFGNDEFRQLLDQTQLGNHPEVIRAFAKIGKMIQDDNFVKPGQEPVKEPSLVDIFYPQEKAK